MFYPSAFIKAAFGHLMFRTALNRQAGPHRKLLLYTSYHGQWVHREEEKSIYGYVQLNVIEYQADCGKKHFCGSDMTEYSTNPAGANQGFCN